MGPGVLREVVAAGELLAAVVALERFVVRVQGAVVALEVFLASEAARAEGADEGLGGVFGQGLFATAASDCLRGCGCGVGVRGEGDGFG